MHLYSRLISAETRIIDRKKQNFIAMTSKLDAMSPLKVLMRGYSMAQSADGSVIRSVDQVRPGDILKISLSDGQLTASVTEVKEDK